MKKYKEETTLIFLSIISIILYFIKKDFLWINYAALCLVAKIFIDWLNVIEKRLKKLENNGRTNK